MQNQLNPAKLKKLLIFVENYVIIIIRKFFIERGIELWQ